MPCPIELACGKLLSTPFQSYIAGILNSTPDSFWDKSRVPFGSKADVSCAVERALSLVEEGCDILDIGAESTRPGAKYINAEEEQVRLIPLIEGIRKYSSIPISIDTRKASVMKAALEVGADILNDVSALEDDAELGPICAKAGIPVILMHGGSQSGKQMDAKPSSVLRYLLERAKAAEALGIKREKIILDPGIGFGKEYKESFNLIRDMDTFAAKGYHVMLGVSRKSCIGEITGRDAEKRLAGTLAAEMFAAMRGASILRVHDVRETKDMLAVLKELSA